MYLMDQVAQLLLFFLQRGFRNSATDPAEVDVATSDGTGNGRGAEKERGTSSADLRTHEAAASGLVGGERGHFVTLFPAAGLFPVANFMSQKS